MSNEVPKRHPHRSVTDERIDTYLRVLEATGSEYEAAAAASPHCVGEEGRGRPGWTTFRDLEKNDPEFAQRKHAAMIAFLGRGEAAVAKRAFEPTVRESYNRKGELVGREVRWADADKLLLRLLARHDPRWREGRSLQVDGQIAHTSDNAFGVTLTATDVLLLSPERRALFVELLTEIRNARTPREGLNVIDAQPARPARLIAPQHEQPDSSGGTQSEDSRGHRHDGGEG